MSLQPCRFFAQGNCRYGNNCRFYHGQAGGGGATTTNFFGNRTLAPATFQPQQQQQQQQGALNLSAKGNQNLDIIVETVVKDMQEWQNSGIWPYSSYGPIGGKPGVPGFEDLSSEEYRYNFMLNGGTLPPQIPLHFQTTCQLRMSYQTYSQENRVTLERIATATGAPTSAVTPQQQQVASIFGGSPSGNQQVASIFGGSGGTQQTTPVASIFGGGATTGQTGGVFNSQKQTTSSIFGGGSTFGAPTNTGTPSLFGQPPAVANPVGAGIFQSQQPSLFGGPPAFGQSPIAPVGGGGGLFTQPQSIFGQNQPTQQQQIPQQQQTQQPPTAPSLFQQPAAGMVPFQQQATNQAELFQTQQQQQQLGSFGGSNLFNPGQPQQQPQYSTPSIFGGTGPTGNSPLMQGGVQGPAIATAPSRQKGVYTDESELTPEELEAFKADEFTLENLPTRPPPQSMCL